MIWLRVKQILIYVKLQLGQRKTEILPPRKFLSLLCGGRKRRANSCILLTKESSLRNCSMRVNEKLLKSNSSQTPSLKFEKLSWEMTNKVFKETKKTKLENS